MSNFEQKLYDAVRQAGETICVTEDVTFYAKWAEAVYVTWIAEGGSFTYNEISEEYVLPVKKDGLLNVNMVANREGYVLAGWYFDQEYTQFFNMHYYILTEDVTLYAKWAEAVNVTFDGNGGTVWGDDASYTFPYAKNSGISMNWLAIRDGYAFDGWYLDPECTECVDSDYYHLTEDVTFYAKWSEPVYITYDGRGGHFSYGKSTYTQTLVKNKEVYIYPPDVVRDGYTLEDWYLDEECTKKINYFFAPTENVTFYAKWEPANN